MTFRELTTEAYLDYQDLIDTKAVSFEYPLLSFEYASGNRIQYDWQENDFTRELVNKFNKFVISIHKLRLWELVISQSPKEQQYELRSEFTDALLENSIGYPYRYKSNLIFCATTLCYIDGLSRRMLSKNEISEPSDINLNSFIRIRDHVCSADGFIRSVSAIDDTEFRDATLNFRNRLQHQHAPRLDWGQTSYVRISFPDGKGTSFEFGVQEPLKAAELVSCLSKQIEPMRLGFFAYREIVDEHIRKRT